MVFLSLSDLSISMCAGSDMDYGTHLRTRKQAIFTEILQIGFVTGLLPWLICIFSGNRSVKLLGLKQVITVLNRNVTESTFTYSHLVTFQNTVISKGSVTTITV